MRPLCTMAKNKHFVPCVMGCYCRVPGRGGGISIMV